MKPTGLAILLCFLFFVAQAKEQSIKPRYDGFFSLGIRSTQSLFGSSGYSGMGFGGQFSIRVNDFINTEWYADYIKTDIGGAGYRETNHIGWSVMFDLIKTGSVKPYLLAGHCFDYAKLNSNIYKNDNYEYVSWNEERWTSAVQLGIGSTFEITDRFDFSISAQYMSHLGNELEASIAYDSAGDPYLQKELIKPTISTEGHLLLTFSMDYILRFRSKPIAG